MKNPFKRIDDLEKDVKLIKDCLCMKYGIFSCTSGRINLIESEIYDIAIACGLQRPETIKLQWVKKTKNKEKKNASV
jgi:hypothetical protein